MTTPNQNNPFSRRSFLRRAGLAGITAAAVPIATNILSSTAKAVPATDIDVQILTFALNLEYLEAEYYSYGINGTGLLATDTDGRGTSGPTTVKTDSSTKVTFTNPIIESYLTEIAADESLHVKYLRAALAAAGANVPAKPPINLFNSFNEAAKAAGIGDTFDPYANEINFAIGGFIFEDVGVTAYLGAATQITNPAYLRAAGGILAVEAYHAATLRTLLYGQDQQNPDLGIADITLKISDLRDSLDGKSGRDQPIVNTDGSANITPTNTNAIAYSRGVGKVLNIVYGTHAGDSGLFFPSGINTA